MIEYDVTVDRNSFIGGSDLAVIMGISPFKKRFDLLLEKAGLKEDTFTGTKYTEYGNIIEPQIRDYINRNRKKKFEPNRTINGDIRCHTDGFNGECVLEIKSTSHIYQTVSVYKIYLVQLIKYMEQNNVKKGKLAVYHRPDDLNPVFDPKRLQVFDITMNDYKELLDEVNREIDRFRVDLEKMKANPLLSEQDFLQSEELISLSNTVVAFENKLAQLKFIEQQCKDAKKALYEEMVKHGVKSWNTPNGTKLTMVEEIPASTETVTEFDEAAFRIANPSIYKLYLKPITKQKSGRSGYVKVTLPK